jgi:integrase
MPRRRSPPRLYFDKARQHWVVRDGTAFVRTGCGKDDRREAEKTLASYIATKHAPEPSPEPLIADVMNLYAAEAAPYLKTAKNVAYNIGNILKWWGAKLASEVTTKNCRAYANTKTAQAARSDLNVLKWAMKYWHNSEHGPLSVMPTYWLPPPSAPRERWLTRSEAARLLWAARRYPHIRRFILLGLYTGSRSGVLMRMRWNQIDLAAGIMSRVPAGTLQDRRKRAPRVKLGRRILAHLKRWKQLDARQSNMLADQLTICHYHGTAVAKARTAWENTVRAAALPLTGPDKVTKHTLRHTTATWLLQKGLDLWTAAGFLGMSLKTLERVYGHHCPNYQEQAANLL